MFVFELLDQMRSRGDKSHSAGTEKVLQVRVQMVIKMKVIVSGVLGLCALFFITKYIKMKPADN